MRPALEPFTLGTHNLHDDTGTVTPFADWIIFTEFPVTPARRAAALTILRLRGYVVVTDKRQPDLVQAYKRRLFKPRGHTYTHAVDGVAKVTPNRGTLVAFADQRATGVQIAGVGEHRINAWYPPFIRGEASFRAKAWRDHEKITGRLIEQLEGSGYRVVAGGDTNTPHGINAYELTRLHEVGTRLDRVASRRIGGSEELSRMGSDHWRLRATVKP